MSTKRKAATTATAASPERSGTPAAKKRKQSHVETETAEATAQVGFELLTQLRKSRDKQQWLITTHFETLPDKKEIPDYYERIALPIALETLERKLQQRGYESISALESDVKRMVSNAKSYNNKNSQIYSDAEKIRKLVSNFMVERNPAYKDPNYQAIATPVPPKAEPEPKQEVSRKRGATEVKVEPSTNGSKSDRRASRSAVRSPSQQHTKPAASTSSGPEEENVTENAFTGLTFQQAQEKILQELTELTDEDNRLVAANFINLPSRSLTDYYKLIKHPVSLKGLQKLVKGAKGSATVTGSTTLRSWEEFEQEVDFIWNNAREYNEDGSEIVQMAEELEYHFHELLEKAKAVVSEPPQPKVKLRFGNKSPEPAPKITLKFGQPKSDPPTKAPASNEPSRTEPDQSKKDNRSQTPSVTASQPSTEKAPSLPAPNTGVNGIKRETSGVGSPAIAPSQAATNATAPAAIAPTPQPPRVPSGSPHPQAAAMPAVPAPVPAYSSSNFDSQWRQNGKTAADALITNLNLLSLTDPSVAQPFRLNVRASEKRTQQSLTVTLPYHSKHLRIAPVLSSTLMQRPSKVFVTWNNRRLQPLAQRDLDQIRPIYEQPLIAGLNAIEVEVIAGTPRGAPKIGSGSDLEMEKITIFANLQHV